MGSTQGAVGGRGANPNLAPRPRRRSRRLTPGGLMRVSFTDTELAAVMNVAASIPPDRRGDFLQVVANLVEGDRFREADDVDRAIRLCAAQEATPSWARF